MGEHKSHMTTAPMRPTLMSKPHLSHPACCATSLIILFLLNCSITIQCTTNHAINNTKSITSDTSAYCEVIQPMLIEKLPNQEDSLLTPLLVNECPHNLTLLLQTSFGDEFVIQLVKNKRLISDRYFKIINDQIDNLGTINHHEPKRRLLVENGKNTHKSALPSSSPPDGYDDFYKTHKFLPLHNLTTNDDHCHYNGFINDNSNSIVAMSIVNSKLLNGFLNTGQHIFLLIADVSKSSTFIKKTSTSVKTLNDDIAHCRETNGYSTRLIRQRRDTNILTGGTSTKRRRFLKSNPDNKVLHEPFLSNASSLYVELLVVHDHSQYTENAHNTSLIAERTMQIVNIMNAFYRQLNIFVVLVGVVLWTEKDEIKLTEDGDSTLTNFLKYRYEKLLPRYHHDNAQLITSTSFNGSVVGKALKGPICTHDHSGGVNTDHSHNPAIVAVTLAHELGHNLGMEHDEDDKCKCPDEKCIMSSSSSFVHPKHWSSCSIDYLEDARKHGLLDCLRNEPGQIFGPICGNGFVEEGEDCDTGEPIPSYGTSKSRYNKNSIRSSNGAILETSLSARNPCCDRTTCKFTVNSTCAQGPCCDLTRCSVFNASDARVCRHRKTECDFEEVCDGISEYCPVDVHYHDGIECGPTVSLTEGISPPVIESAIYNRSRAYCYNGHCSSHESQCQLLWGPTGSTSKDICYEQNIHGNTSGNCGYNRLDKTFDGCEMENAACGMLHCVHGQSNNGDPSRKTGKLNFGFESASILTMSFLVMSNHAKIYCHGAIIDAGPGMRDPGLVPNGAACGDERMCLNQKCVSIYDVLHQDWCPSDCNGNGICDNMGVCHCNDGTIGTSCYQFFGSNFHLSLILYILMFFGPVIALIILAANHYSKQVKIWWFLHNRKIVLRNKARESNHHRRLAYDASGHKVSISEPMPLNQQNNSNRPFFQTSTDPWAETNQPIDSGGKSIGYRLEPLKKQQQLPPPPPLPDYQINQPAAPCYTPAASAAAHSNEDLKPVRSAPPPPIPPHRHNLDH